MLGGKKWGGWAPGEVGGYLKGAGIDSANVTLAVNASVLDSWEPVLKAALPDAVIVHDPALPQESAPAGKPVVLLSSSQRPPFAEKGFIAVMPIHREVPVLFGYVWLMSSPEWTSFFTPVVVSPVRVGPLWSFGMLRAADRSTMYLRRVE